MCLRFDSCFGMGHDHDDGPPASKAPPPRNAAPGRTTTPPPPVHRNGYPGNGHPYPAAAGDDATDRKASNGARAGPAHALVATAAAPPGVTGQDTASVRGGGDETSKPAANQQVGNGAGHGAHYYAYEREHAAGHRYPAATATSIANHGRY